MDKRINIMFWAGALFGVLGLISVVLDWPDLLSWTLIGLNIVRLLRRAQPGGASSADMHESDPCVKRSDREP